MTNPSDDGETPPDDRDRDDSQPPGTAKRRRTGTTRGRGVANLTAEQLDRKRANDREAQRAIRERTKNQIEGLKARIQELEGSQPYHELQLVVRERDAARAELAETRRRVESSLAVLQPIVSLAPPSGLNELATAAEQNPLPIPRPPHEPAYPPSSRPPEARVVHSQHASIAGASPQNGVHSPAADSSNRPWLLPGDAPTSHVRHWSGESSHSQFTIDHTQPVIHHNNHSHHEMPLDGRDGRMPVSFMLDNGQGTVDPNLPGPPPRDINSMLGQYAPQLVPHLTLPRTIPATCPLDVIMLDFLAESAHRARAGVPLSVLAGPMYPNFTALVSPSDRLSDSHLLSKLFTDIIQTFPDICRLPEQVAVVFIMFLIMRWQIEPTQKNYDRLPDWATPRASQLFVPHPYWINHLPWPRLRDRLITHQPFTSFNEFFVPFTTTLSLNWPYAERDCLIRQPSTSGPPSIGSIGAASPYAGSPVASGRPSQPPLSHTPLSHPPNPNPPRTNTPGSVHGSVGGTVGGSGGGMAGGSGGGMGGSVKEEEQWVINPAFETHLRDLGNWSLGASFGTTFPHFKDTVRIKER